MILNSRILIVDDNQDNVSLLETMLSEAGDSNIIGITDSRNAQDLYQAFEPDIVLLDLNMPFLDGFQVMEGLKELKSDDYIPVLILTASQSEDVRLRALNSGAKDFLSKPFNQTEVLARIHNILEVRLLHTEIRSKNEELEKQKAILEDKVRERTRELHETRLEIIRRLGLAAEYRDNETGYHIIRMSKMSQTLALASGISTAEAEIILNASPMHDIGKIGIPDRVLLKPGRLNDDEWQIMKTHTIVGGKMLGGHNSRLLMAAKEIALTHHERWNGKGYPNGLKGSDIPISGRICAIADVFDALTSDRPYKKAWSIPDTVDEIIRGKGEQFDPDLIDLFEKNIGDFIEIKKLHQEPAHHSEMPLPIA